VFAPVVFVLVVFVLVVFGVEGAVIADAAAAGPAVLVEVGAPGWAGAVCANGPAVVLGPAPVCRTVATAVTAPMPAAPPSSVSAALRIGPGFLCVATCPHLPLCATPTRGGL